MSHTFSELCDLEEKCWKCYGCGGIKMCCRYIALNEILLLVFCVVLLVVFWYGDRGVCLFVVSSKGMG